MSEYHVIIKGEPADDDGLTVTLPGNSWDDAQEGICPDCGATWFWFEAGHVPGTRYKNKFHGSNVSPEVADALALEADWKAVGHDLQDAMKVVRVKQGVRLMQDMNAYTTLPITGHQAAELQTLIGRELILLELRSLTFSLIKRQRLLSQVIQSLNTLLDTEPTDNSWKSDAAGTI